MSVSWQRQLCGRALLLPWASASRATREMAPVLVKTMESMLKVLSCYGIVLGQQTTTLPGLSMRQHLGA